MSTIITLTIIAVVIAAVVGFMIGSGLFRD
jgi:hypothetical protein